MASQIDGGSCHEWSSYVRGYHEYKDIWSPFVGEMLRLTVEHTNPHDSFAVAVEKDGTAVGHIPKNISRIVSFFLKKDGNVGFCEVTGTKVNRGAGLGLEIPCVYRLYGHQKYVERLRTLLLQF